MNKNFASSLPNRRERPLFRSGISPGISLVLLFAFAGGCCSSKSALSEGEAFPLPSFIDDSGEHALLPREALPGSPFRLLQDALKAARVYRSGDSTEDDVVVIARIDAGWSVVAYRPQVGTPVSLFRISSAGLPLAADPLHPMTYVIDSDGFLGRLEVKSYPRLQPVAADAHGMLVAVADWNRALQLRQGAEVPSLAEPAAPVDVVSGFLAPARVISNHARNVEWRAAYVLRPDQSLRSLSHALNWISVNLDPKIGVRAVGSRHSWSSVGLTDGVSVLPSPLTDLAQAIVQVRPATPTSGPLYRVHASVRIQELNDELQRKGLAIPYLGGFDGQTLGGVFATGTHGSVPALGPLADLIRSIDLVQFNGDVLRIEPARAPISDSAREVPTDPRSVLKRDDDLFDSVRLGFGTFGVIHSLVLEVVPKYWLCEVRTLTTLDAIRPRLEGEELHKLFLGAPEVLAKLRNENLPDPARPGGGPFKGHPLPAFHFELLWNPYGQGKTLITTRHWVEQEKREKYKIAEPAELEKGKPRELPRLANPRSRRSERPGATEFLAEHFATPAAELIEAIAREKPELMPALIDQSIEGLLDEEGYVERSYRVFNIGKYTNQVPSLSATISVPLSGDRWLQAVDIIRNVSLEHLKRGVVQSGPIALRFVAGSKALLGDADEVCKFEIIFGGSGEKIRRNADELVRAHFLALRAAMGDVVHLHFGQLIPPGTLDVQTLGYPRYAEWRRLRDGLDPNGRGLTPWLRSILH